jgi:ribosomal protein S18 acetylase RimI-like enzyme
VSITVTITELDRAGFLANLDVQLDIYRAAMGADGGAVSGRKAVMERHADYPGLRSLAAVEVQSQHVVGFAYGFHGLAGQWWHDVVWDGIAERDGHAVAHAWLDSSLEIAEVHVRPDYQARGIGRRMMLLLTARRPEPTALLSTRDAHTPARRLYRELGFTDLLTDFRFPGGSPPYAVMGAPLPLPAPSSG